jgi:hypothetical protein
VKYDIYVVYIAASTLRKYRQSRKMRKNPRKSLKSRTVAKRRKNMCRARRGDRGGSNDLETEEIKKNKEMEELLKRIELLKSDPDQFKYRTNTPVQLTNEKNI